MSLPWDLAQQTIAVGIRGERNSCDSVVHTAVAASVAAGTVVEPAGAPEAAKPARFAVSRAAAAVQGLSG